VGQNQTLVTFTSLLCGPQPDELDVGPSWTALIDCRADGAPSADALFAYDARGMAADLAGYGEQVDSVKADWGRFRVAYYWPHGRTIAQHLTPFQVAQVRATDRPAQQVAA
jgi:hypothetical protein